MKYKIGQKVFIKRANGELDHKPKGSYYYGGSFRDLPLGSKGTINEIVNENMIGLRVEKQNYGYRWYVHPSELPTPEEINLHERKEQEKINSQLKSILLADEPIVKMSITRQKSFDPKFNAREEFVVWIREEFPELKKYSKNKRKYSDLINRKKEVMEGAKKAYEHALKTTDSCVRVDFIESFKELNKRMGNFANGLDEFVTFIEYVSANLINKKDRHYGTTLARRIK
ncbi:MAG TPA: hypothetical protein VJJ23_02985 [Candidatus Nanoarchaeia archaeon]|nr:hypothetical protein [Candidatus Nanoarchaeia archaeon]